MRKEMDKQSFLDFFQEDDLMFYDRFLNQLTDEELGEFLREYPEFMKAPLEDKDRAFQKEHMLQNIFRELRGNIK